MQIFLKAERTRAIEVEDVTTVLDVKDRVARNPSDVILSFAGKPLEDSATFAASGVQDGSTLYVSLRLRGGRGTEPFMEDAASLDFYSQELKFEERSNVDLLSTLDTKYVSEASVPTPAAAIDSGNGNMWSDLVHPLATQTFQPSLATDPWQQSSNESVQPQASQTFQPPLAPDQWQQSSTFVPVSVSSLEEFPTTEEDTDAEYCSRSFKTPLTSQFPNPTYTAPFQTPVPPQQCYGVAPSVHVQQHRKGTAYDLDLVEDERLRKRLLKNRRSAERSRQKKNAALKESEDALHESKAQNEQLMAEMDELRKRNEELSTQHEMMRELLLANGILLPF